MSGIERYLLSPIPNLRSWLAVRLVLFVFAFDTWADHLSSAWRYGKAGFNVAHFSLFDAVLPTPSARVYAGVMISLGLCAFVAATIPRPPRALFVVIAVGYFWSWSCSMHDSYQHHYLLSLYFVAFCFVPRDVLDRVVADRSKNAKLVVLARAPSFGLVLVWITSAIVYSYTAVSKSELEWRNGDVLREMTDHIDRVRSFVDVFTGLGIDETTLWWLLGHSVIALQIVCALGYAAAPIRDSATGRLQRVLSVLAVAALVLALSFHVGAELMGLKIGWFSGYMIALAIITFAPIGLIERFASARGGEGPDPKKKSAPREVSAVVAGGCAVLAAAALIALGGSIGLPGGLEATWFIACVVVVGGIAAQMRASLARPLRNASLALLIASPLVIFALRYLGPPPEQRRGTPHEPHHDVRYDYWRFAGGDYRRRGEWALALDAYERANVFAPAGVSRRQQVDEMRQRIEHEGPRRAEHERRAR